MLCSFMLAALLAWIPMPFGSVAPWSEALLGVSLAALAALGLALAADRVTWRALRWPALFWSLLVALAAFQTVAWPLGWLRVIAPERARLSEQAAALVGSPAHAAALSLAPDATVSAALASAVVLAALLAGGTLGRAREARRVLLCAVLAAGLFESFVGAQLWFARSRTIWGVEVPTQPWRLHGTFVNPDHLAAYLEIGLALALAWLWWAVRRARATPWAETRLLLIAPPALVWTALLLALAFSGSRAGLLGALGGVATQAAVLALANRRWRPVLVGLGIAVLGLAAIATVGLREGLGRFGQVGRGDVSLGARVLLTRSTLALWRSFPVLGTGLGTFPDAFPLVEPAPLTDAFWTHAHDDPAELLATTGVVGAALCAAALAALVRRLGRNVALGARSEDRAAALAALGALASLGLHELFEFALTIPANAVTLAVVCGAAAVVPRAARPAVVDETAAPGLLPQRG
jgi:O-antigen ligase